mgnify:FL=1
MWNLRGKINILLTFIGLMSALSFGQVIFSSTSYASGFSWMSGDLTGSKDVTSTQYSGYGDCKNQTVQIVTYSWQGYTDKSVCLFTAKSFHYAISDGRLFVSTGDSTKMDPVNNYGFSSYNYVLPSPETDDFIFNTLVVKNLLSKLTLVDNGSNKYYEPADNFFYNLGEDENGSLDYTPQGIAISHNGKWEVMNLKDVGLVRFNLESMTATRLAPYTSSSSLLAISNDGTSVAETSNGTGWQPVIYNVDNCGQTASKYQSVWKSASLSNPCESRNVSDAVNSALGANSSVTNEKPDFSDDGGQLVVYALPSGGNSEVKVTLSAHGYTNTQRLDYLALGDSYSSGEGDFNTDSQINHSYFLPHTDETTPPSELCHVSIHSYPFLLRDHYSMDSSSVHSVACSGATTPDVYVGANPLMRNSTTYDGQDDRLKYFAQEVQYQSDAINQFIPGRIEQIKFVEKYKPRVITISIGGNDVGFGEMIAKCVQHANEECSSATNDGEDRQRLARLIHDEFFPLRTLYEQIRNTSPDSKIYVIGYPQFIADSGSPCLLSAGYANQKERHLMNEATSYMNLVIQSAAKAAGAQYIDVEHSLDGGRLCEGITTDYVTGARDEWWVQATGSGGLNDYLYHPNAAGHVRIADTIETAIGDTPFGTNANADNSVAPPNYPDYFAGARGNVTAVLPVKTLSEHVLIQGGTYESISAPLSYQGGSLVYASRYSNPENIGSYVADQNGQVRFTMTIPNNFPVGYHKLVFSGTSPAGNPVQYVENFFVKGSNPQDVDDDGILDSTDKCLFITPIYQDVDADGIDDACDPAISTPKAPYRLREGDSNRTYGGQPERANYLYLERNVNATALTGVSDDSDPDGDGWAIVGASQGKAYRTAAPTSIPDTAPYANFRMTNYEPNIITMPANTIVPVVSLRAGDYGCVEYQPESLAKVEPGQVRVLKLTAQGTSTCRVEPVQADIDHNGQPDNTQPLYLARNGISTNGEDPTRTYLFRNFYAAEAQLGITDYSPTGTAAARGTEPIQTWNLLATSKDVGYSPVFNHLTFTTDSNGKQWPIILARKHNSTNPSNDICIAYQPDSQANTTNIKLATQPTRQLLLMKWKDVPQGVACE